MRHRLRPRWAVPALLAMGLLLNPVLSRTTLAGFTTCRTDPVVTLSNGATVTMYADIQDSVSDISKVSYVLHAPVRTTVTQVQYDQYGYLENFQFVPDLGARSYRTLTTVSTTTSNISVTAFTRMTGQGCSISSSQTGISNQLITFPFSC